MKHKSTNSKSEQRIHNTLKKQRKEKGGRKKVPSLSELEARGWNPNELKCPGNKNDQVSPAGLSTYFINLNELVKQGKIEDSFGWHDEVEDLAKILLQSEKNNIIFEGRARSGKQAVLKALVYKAIKEDKFRNIIGDITFYTVDANLSKLLYAQWRPEDYGLTFFKNFADYLKKKNEKAILILPNCKSKDLAFLGISITKILQILKDCCVLIFDIDIYDESKRSRSRIISSGREETAEELLNNSTKYSHSEPDDKTFKKCQSVMLKELASFHNVKIPKSTVEFIDKYIDESKKYKYYSQKISALKEVLEKASIEIRFNNTTVQEIREEDEELSKKVFTITKDKCKKIIESYFGVNTGKEVFWTTKSWNKIISNIKQSVKGQDQIIDSVMSTIRIGLSAMKPEAKPVASFMFAGTTGVGKTFLCKTISNELDLPMVRFDMSEFQEEHYVSRFIGSPPGYIGMEQGQLTNWASKNPKSIILLDEIDKAHPKILDALLQVLDAGILTSGTGKEADMTYCIVIMTTNFGAMDVISQNKKTGFSASNENNIHDINAIVRASLEKELRPEFINRFDEIFVFNPVTKEIMEDLVAQKFKELIEFAKNKGMSIEVSKKVIETFMILGFDEKYGVRPLHREISSIIRSKVAVIFEDNKRNKIDVRVSTNLKSKQIQNSSKEKLRNSIIIDVVG